MFSFEDVKANKNTTELLFNGAESTFESLSTDTQSKSRSNQKAIETFSNKKKKSEGEDGVLDGILGTDFCLFVFLIHVLGDSLRSVMNHDQLVGWEQSSPSLSRVDRQIQMEAKKLAQGQAEKLRASREQVRYSSFYLVC